MKLSTTIRYALARLLVKAAGYTIVPSWGYRSLLVPAFDSLVAEGVRKNAVYYSCLTALAFSFPEPPLMVWEDDSDSAAPLPNHPLRKLIVNPNADMGEAELKAAIIMWMAIGGNAYLHKLRNNNRQVIGLRPYHDGIITPIPSSDPANPSWIDHYDFRTGDGEVKPIPREDIVHIKWPSLDPRQPWMAQPPILAAAREIDADNEASRYVATLLQNDAIPRTIIEQAPNSAMTPDEVARTKAEWRSEFGNNNRGGIAVLDPGTKITRLALNMEELNFGALHDIPEQRICAVMRVPAVVAGLGDDPTYANSEQAFRRFTLATLVPLWRAVESEIQADLAPEFGNGVAVRHNLGHVQALQEDENNKWGRVSTAFAGGIIDREEARSAIGYSTPQTTALVKSSEPNTTPILGYHIDAGVVSRNEARAQLGLPPEDETVDAKLRRLQSLLTVAAAAVNVGIEPASALSLVGLDPALAETTPLPALPLPAPPKAAKSRASAAGSIRALRRVRTTIEGKLRKAVDGYFADLAERATERAGSKAAGLPSVDDLILDSDGKALGTLFRTYTLELVKASWATWNTALDVDLAFEETDPAVVAALKQSGARVADITETTREFLARMLSESADAGLSSSEIAKGIRLVIEESYKGRAQAIARTEMAMAQNVTTHARFNAAGVERVIVYDGGGDDSDDECNQLNGTTQTLEWAKANPLQHPNCVRAFAPSFED